MLIRFDSFFHTALNFANLSHTAFDCLQAMEEDIENGMFPFFVSTTLGTTGCVAFDNLDEIGKLTPDTPATSFLPLNVEQHSSLLVCSWFSFMPFHTEEYMSRKGEARNVIETVVMLFCDSQMVNTTQAWGL